MEKKNQVGGDLQYRHENLRQAQRSWGLQKEELASELAGNTLEFSKVSILFLSVKDDNSRLLQRILAYRTNGGRATED